jgi:hypothetical protein
LEREARNWRDILKNKHRTGDNEITNKESEVGYKLVMMNGDNSSVSSCGISSNLEGSENMGDDMSKSGSSRKRDETTVSNSGTGDGSLSEMSFARQETKSVRQSKSLVCFVLVLAATAGAFQTFEFLEKEDEEAMAKQVSSAKAMSWILGMPQN